MQVWNIDRARLVVIDASILGTNEAASRWGLSHESVGRYKRRLEGDAVLAKMKSEILSALELGWKAERQQYLRAAVTKLREITEDATIDHMDVLSRAIERVGNLDIAAEALGENVRPQPIGDDSESAETATDADEGAEAHPVAEEDSAEPA